MTKRMSNGIYNIQDQNPDLYNSIPWSYGTLGFLVSVKIKIIPAKRSNIAFADLIIILVFVLIVIS